MDIVIIVAVAQNNVIGNNNQLIWHLPEDLKRFKQMTTNHPIIMGRKTFESIGKPLPHRTNIVVSRNDNYKAIGVLIKQSLPDAIDYAKTIATDKIFIIGGAEIYKQALKLANTIEMTKINHFFEGDTFFPIIDMDQWKIIHNSVINKNDKNIYDYSFITLKLK